MSCSSQGGRPRRPRPRASSASPSAPTPRRARWRSSSRAPSGSRRSPTIPGAPWQVLPYERQLEVKQEQVEDALRRIGRLDGFALEPIVPAVEQWRYRNKLEYSFGTDPDGRLDLRLPRPRALGGDRRGDATACSPPRPATRPASGSSSWCRDAGPDALRPPHRRGPAAQPRRARGPPHRPAPGPPGHQPRASSTATALADAAAALDGAALDADRQRRPRPPRAARPSCVAGVGPARGGARRPAPAHLPGGVLPDQHRDGRAALRARDRVRASCAASSASTTSTAGSARSAC